MDPINCKLVAWDEIDAWTNKVAAKIAGKGYKPDVCIGMTRGGWVPSRLICDRLRIKDLHAIKTEHWGITATRDGEAKLAAPLTIDVKKKNLLVVDDITDTGQSLGLALEHAKALGASSVMSATLLHITHSKVTPDFYAVKVPADDWTWFIFPWNFNEDVQSLVRKALDDGEKAERDIIRMLREQCNISLDLEVLKRTLAELTERNEVKKKGAKWSNVKKK